MAKRAGKPGKRAEALKIRSIRPPAAAAKSTRLKRVKPKSGRRQSGKRSSEAARLKALLRAAEDRQSATAEILKVIASSPSDVQPVFHAIATSANRLIGGHSTTVLRIVGDTAELAAFTPVGPEADAALTALFPRPISASDMQLAQVLQGQVMEITDTERAGELITKNLGRARGFRSRLLVPLRTDDDVVGVISITRKEPGSFPKQHVALLHTFADQAVIAIKNARLFNEVQIKTRDLTESLQQQTATADVLKVISRSAFDLQPVLDTLVTSAGQLCGADAGIIWLRKDDLFHAAAASGFTAQQLAFFKDNPRSIHDKSLAPRVLRSRRTVHIPDRSLDAEFAFPGTTSLPSTMLGVPLLRDDQIDGVFTLTRSNVAPFTPRQIELVESFADQAVIAIGNARLFNEVQTKTRDLTESLQQQTATADVLKVISRSAFELQPVLDTLVKTAAHLCDADMAFIYRQDGEFYRTAAAFGMSREYDLHMRAQKLVPGRDTLTGRTVLEGRVVHIDDLTLDPEYRLTETITLGNVRTTMGVPLVRDGNPVGVFSLGRRQVRPFTTKQIELVTTFADQAVIAIENVRLFSETREALERQTATADVLKIIAASPTDVQPVFEAIVQTAVRLLGCETSFIQRCDSSCFWSVARCRKEGLLQVLNPRRAPIDPAANFPSRAMVAKKTLYLPDWSEIELPEFERRIQQELGYNCAIYLPLLYKDECLGVLGMAGSRPRMFSDADIALAEAFRDQAVIAIRNTQLFEEVQQRTDELSQSLEDLRTAQDRLVQTEKLASLGQLTAGIAHEIKNPLNFVNNFSALSAELSDELSELLKPVVLDRTVRGEVDELTGLLKDNLLKVVQHGKRADSIVKNMLLHSREGSGERRSADINALVGESLNLAYHGARAEKPDFAITLKHDLDPDAGALELYPQEITRALLNLISNGFYAATGRKAETDDKAFEPVLTAATRNLGETVEIRIRDNGSGIPAHVREKMFNPFFTTKPTGEGTGLGLSMTHDIIVKQHGGRIDVETEPGAFTELIVTLPRGGTRVG